MIDLSLLREKPEIITKKILSKDPSFAIEKLIALDEQIRSLGVYIEDLRKEKNELAKQAQGGVTEEIRNRSIELGKDIKKNEARISDLEDEFHVLYLSCPNVPEDDVPVGDKEQNQVIRTIGKKPVFSFEPRHHLDLATHLGWIDFQAGAKIAASNFALYKNEGAKFLYALSVLMMKNNMKHGYELIIPPLLVNEESLRVSGNFPKFKEQVYAVEKDNLYLTPTSEVDLANMYRDHIFSADDLPARMTAWTSCFRREAGHYGSTERGLIRIHQFEKVELYTLCKPENSADELDKMIACAEDILKTLDLHYRISLLATQDMSFQAAKTYDIEVWLPGQNAYMEVSSASNCSNFQAQRGLIRYKEKGAKKTQLVHTLNASSLALPRLMVALMETYQNQDGTIDLPDIIKREITW